MLWFCNDQSRTHPHATCVNRLLPYLQHGMQLRSQERPWQQEKQHAPPPHHHHHHHHFHEEEEEEEDEEHDVDEEDDEEHQERSSLSPSPAIGPIGPSEPLPPAAFDYHRAPPPHQQRDACVSSIRSDGNRSAESATSSSPLSETFRGDYCANKCTVRLVQRRQLSQQQQHQQQHRRQSITDRVAPAKHVQFTKSLAKVPEPLGAIRKVRKKRRKVSNAGAAAGSGYGAALLPPKQLPHPERRPGSAMKLSKAYLYTARSRREGFLAHRDVVYNGTYPIDLPFCSRFKDYNYSGESTDSAANSEEREGRKPAIDEGIRDYFEGTELGSLRCRRRPNASHGKAGAVLTYAIDEPL